MKGMKFKTIICGAALLIGSALACVPAEDESDLTFWGVLLGFNSVPVPSPPPPPPPPTLNSCNLFPLADSCTEGVSITATDCSGTYTEGQACPRVDAIGQCEWVNFTNGNSETIVYYLGIVADLQANCETNLNGTFTPLP